MNSLELGWPRSVVGAPARLRPVARACATLTKPGITVFIGLTAAAGFLLGAGGWSDAATLAHVVVATLLCSAGAAALNQVREHEADGRMRRTSRRPLPAGHISRAEASTVAVGLSVTGLAWSGFYLPWVVTALLAASHASYVLVYTPLKRRTPLCTLVGAIPGTLPVMAGWAAAGAPLQPTAVALAGILYLWQIPHFLSIGWLYREDYARGGFRVLSVLDPDGRLTGRISLVYAVSLVPVALVPGLDGVVGPIATTIAMGASILYAAAAVPLVARPCPGAARRLFFASLLYLPVTLTALTMGRLLG